MKLALALLLLPFAASAKEAGHVKVTWLESGGSHALKLVHQPHWHTYWKNPGDSGIPTKISAGEILWPAPERIVAEPLTSFGYSDTVVLPMKLPAGTKKLTVDWLECAEVCIPGKAVLTPTKGAFDAALPQTDASAVLSAQTSGGAVVLEIAGAHPRAEFFSDVNGAFESARGAVSVAPTRTELVLTPAPGAPAQTKLTGVLVRPGLPPALVSVPVGARGAVSRALLLAFLGGILLNLMPCVFPVLALKVTGLLQRAGGDLRSARLHALEYSAGVILSFLALAGGLIAARAAGSSLGWGFQLQSPWVVGALMLLFVGIGLNLLGLFEVGTRIMSLGGRVSDRNAFFAGVFAVVVAAPCTAPFMGAALGWALSRPAAEALTVFAALGLGTALPYAVLASFPSLLKVLPKPGAWMETLKKALSIPMFATALWLLWVLVQLLGSAAALDGSWKAWSPEAVAEARSSGKQVFVDFTAAWCLSCQVNERVVLARPEVTAALDKGVKFKADWTDKNDVIAKELAKYGRAGVPLYIVYPPNGEAVILPEILTPGLVLEALGEKK